MKVWDDIVFHEQIRNPHGRGEGAGRISRLRQSEHSYAVVQDGRWLDITGKERTIRTHETNVKDSIMVEVEDKKAAK